MIEKITKRESGYDVTIDGKTEYYDVFKIIAYSEYDIIYRSIEGEIYRYDTRTSDDIEYKEVDDEYKTFELTLCKEKCYYQCDNQDEEIEYGEIFSYLESCPEFSHIDDLIAYLIKQCIEKMSSDEAARELLCVVHDSDRYDEDHHHNVRFEKVFELVRLIIGEE